MVKGIDIRYTQMKEIICTCHMFMYGKMVLNVDIL